MSLVNPHDVLGYPNSYERGGYDVSEFRDLGVQLPPTVDENLHEKPGVQSLTQLGQTAYMGALKDDRARARLRRTSTRTCTGWSTRSSGASSERWATPATHRRCGRGP